MLEFERGQKLEVAQRSCCGFFFFKEKISALKDFLSKENLGYFPQEKNPAVSVVLVSTNERLAERK